MRLSIGENIRFRRREMGMTQEQLAEAVGVTVGAVSKWESGLSNPDIGMLPVLADFFECSVDVLLGYQLQCRSAEATVERLRRMRREKNYEEGVHEAEKALLRFPNSFEVNYQAAYFFQLKGMERNEPAALRRSLELLERACGLVSQNTDPKISELSIQTDIGAVYASLGETERALKHLKKYNSCGVNNSVIGQLLAQNKRTDEALPYLSESYMHSLMDLFRVTIGLTNCYGNMKNGREAVAVLMWMYDILEGVKTPGKINYLDRMQVMLLTCAALAAEDSAGREEAEKFLRRAAALAREFDRAPDYSWDGLRFYHGKTASGGDDFGETAAQGVEKTLTENIGPDGELLKLWREILNEEE